MKELGWKITTLLEEYFCIKWEDKNIREGGTKSKTGKQLFLANNSWS